MSRRAAFVPASRATPRHTMRSGASVAQPGQYACATYAPLRNVSNPAQHTHLLGPNEIRPDFVGTIGVDPVHLRTDGDECDPRSCSPSVLLYLSQPQTGPATKYPRSEERRVGKEWRPRR